MNQTEKLIFSQISELEKFITVAEKCIDDEEDEFIWKGKSMFDGEDGYEYAWTHCGERQHYNGKVKALKELLTYIINLKEKEKESDFITMTELEDNVDKIIKKEKSNSRFSSKSFGNY